jgi:hypothetical protein
MGMADDYYAVLGVPRHASRAEIQKAYRDLAHRYHPDANPDDPEAAKRFVQIEDAYEMLCEPERRKPKGAYHTVASAFMTVHCMRRPLPERVTVKDTGFVLPLVTMATVMWLALVGGCLLMLWASGEPGTWTRADWSYIGPDVVSPRDVVGVAIALITLGYVAFVAFVIGQSDAT